MDPLIRVFLIGPAVAAMYGLYALAVTRKGPLRVVIGVPFMALNCLFNATSGTRRAMILNWRAWQRCFAAK